MPAPAVAVMICDGPRRPLWPLLMAAAMFAHSVAPLPGMLSKISGAEPMPGSVTVAL